jgi:hypothetical protein
MCAPRLLPPRKEAGVLRAVAYARLPRCGRSAENILRFKLDVAPFDVWRVTEGEAKEMASDNVLQRRHLTGLSCCELKLEHAVVGLQTAFADGKFDLPIVRRRSQGVCA